MNARAAPRDGDLAPGDVLADRYELLRLLGSGGLGVVFAARDLELEEDIALKVVRTGAVPDAVKSLRREVRLARRVTHPNVARTYDLVVSGEHRFITMELVRGAPLSSRIARGGTLQLADALRIAAEVTRGLVAAHAAGVVHRDLKPANVLLAPMRTVITDSCAASTPCVGMRSKSRRRRPRARLPPRRRPRPAPRASRPVRRPRADPTTPRCARSTTRRWRSIRTSRRGPWNGVISSSAPSRSRPKIPGCSARSRKRSCGCGTWRAAGRRTSRSCRGARRTSACALSRSIPRTARPSTHSATSDSYTATPALPLGARGARVR